MVRDLLVDVVDVGLLDGDRAGLPLGTGDVGRQLLGVGVGVAVLGGDGGRDAGSGGHGVDLAATPEPGIGLKIGGSRKTIVTGLLLC